MVYDHAHRNDLSYEEKCQTWYSKRELHLIQRGNEETIQWMIGGSKSADDGSDAEYYCSRGLEYKTTMGSLIRRKQRRDALEKILDYQYFAWESGIKVNPESLAKIYSFYSDHSSKVACLLASIDQQSLAEPEEDDPPDTPMEDSKIQKARGLAVAA